MGRATTSRSEHTMIDKDIRNITDEVRQRMYQHCPNLRALCYPKELTSPLGYGNPEDLELCAFVGASVNARRVNPLSDVTSYSVHATCSLLIRYQVPTYFVSRELCEALLKTEAPEDMLFSDIQYPMPAMLFVLPWDFSQTYFGFPTPFVTVAQVPKEHLITSPLIFDGEKTRDVCVVNKNAFFLTTMLIYENGLPMHYDARCPMDRPIKDLMYDAPFQFYTRGQQPFSTNTEAENRETIRRMTNLALNIVLAMTVEPELITRERIIRAAKKDGKKIIRRALWKPNFIGEHFRVVYENQPTGDGTHRSPYAHWRRGHWRNQRYGEKLSLVKRLWIQPVFVGLQSEYGDAQ